MNVWQTKACTKSILFYCFLDWTLLIKRARTRHIFSSSRKTWNGRFESGRAYLSEFVGRWRLKSTHQKQLSVHMGCMIYIAFRSGDNVTVFHWQHAHCSTIMSKRSVLLLKIQPDSTCISFFWCCNLYSCTDGCSLSACKLPLCS